MSYIGYTSYISYTGSSLFSVERRGGERSTAQ